MILDPSRSFILFLIDGAKMSTFYIVVSRVYV